ncbi:unnamed protein product [Amoebophrya sp. A25]|nr:unnamed protein product [Amoebophrya sp. A25]|eukprot:GSA25T00014923001.1
MPKVARVKKGSAMRHDPLAVQMEADDANRNLRTQPRKKAGRVKSSADDAADENGAMLDSKMTKKVLDGIAAQRNEEDLESKLDLAGAKEAQDEDNLDNEIEEPELEDEDGFVNLGNYASLLTPEEEEALQMFLPPQVRNKNTSTTSASSSPASAQQGGSASSTTSSPAAGDKNMTDEDMMMGTSSSGAEHSRSLADIVLEKLKDRTEEITRLPNEATARSAAQHANELSPKVIETYTEIGKWLKTYKSGKMPKPFLVIPSLQNWEEILCLTNPLDWSPNALREATKIFASQLNGRMAQRFYNLVLLPAIRSDMAENKKLNFHYYESLKKAMFKPAAFMKGILLPLARDSCTLREAHIVCSVLGKISVPVLHASATLVRLAENPEWYGTTAMYMAVLINKKYSLPYSVMGKLVDHFYSFLEDERELPLVWHRCLLLFVQRYKADFNDEQRKKLKQLLKVHCHERGIGQEVKRELMAVAMNLFKNTAFKAGGAAEGKTAAPMEM